MLAAVGEGLFVQSMTGVHSGVNPISGDFSVGAEGLMIRDGRLAEPVREITVASTLQRMLLSLVAVGADVEWLPASPPARRWPSATCRSAGSDRASDPGPGRSAPAIRSTGSAVRVTWSAAWAAVALVQAARALGVDV